jgi:hypothetical protein
MELISRAANELSLSPGVLTRAAGIAHGLNRLDESRDYLERAKGVAPDDFELAVELVYLEGCLAIHEERLEDAERLMGAVLAAPLEAAGCAPARPGDRHVGPLDGKTATQSLLGRGSPDRTCSTSRASSPAQLERDRAEHQGRSEERAGPERLVEHSRAHRGADKRCDVGVGTDQRRRRAGQ